ncbi:hypothetical protein PPL_09306 [Heterostelium album PN500]|uniref:Uncharacterized protein n=1 Tax=Heterostelium pallidum (strain ATCC 26659 / Pp 5 / PN500) TaxID=670386 RepID=D3BL74_HETP5|nr:hypothetical protein PPL_09306 [Heterostelium album PN500]EFA77808.1 hypothetical protein PPL_09306 [Heterostelium album PN500]|eukprot:XP_020429936.1 hypothetical protein PPL_09306 [Heterostelium album PN500]
MDEHQKINVNRYLCTTNHNNNKSINVNNLKNNHNNINEIQKNDILSKDLRDIGIYLPEEVDDDAAPEEYDEFGNLIEYDDEGEPVVLSKQDRNLLKMVEHQQNAQALTDKIRGIDESNLFGNVPVRDIAEAQQEWDHAEYENKQKMLGDITHIDLEDKVPERVELYNEISNRFSVVDDERHIHFRDEDEPSTSSSSEPHFSDQIPAINIASNDDLSTRISKIRQRLQKNQSLSGRLTVEDINKMYQLYREDPELNSAESLAQRFSLDVGATKNMLQYFAVPIVVKYNTGVKSGHWSVIFEQ